MLRHQFQHAPEGRVVPEGKLRADAQGLLAELLVADGVVEAEARMLFGLVKGFISVSPGTFFQLA